MSERKPVVDVNGVRYELGKCLGRGGQGAVYALKGGRLAVKIVHGRSRSAHDRIRNQLTFVRRLPIQDLDLAKPLEVLRPPHAGYVMELLTEMAPIKTLFAPPKGESPSVEWYLQTGGLRHRLRILARTARVLAQLHGKGLAYSDPSPGNIFISADPAFTEVRLIDTDNLRYESAPGRQAGVYTPGYGAPELVQGRSGITTLTDAHAFAVIAFQVLTLNHPFIGDYVNEGEPELEDQAFSGLIPWIDDAKDDLNRASTGVPREWVLSKRLRRAFERTFGAGRETPTARPGVVEWAERLSTAADATLLCPGCGGSYYMNQSLCTWCEAPRPTFATTVFNLWSPENGGEIIKKPKNGGKIATRVAHGAVTAAAPLIVTRRQAFGDQGNTMDEPVLEVSLDGDRLSLRSLDGETYRLVSPSGEPETTVSDKPQTHRLVHRKASWRLHFGSEERLHRVLRFELYPESAS